MADPVRPEDVEALIAQFEAAGCTELHLRFEGFELHLSNDATMTTASAGAAPSSAPAEALPVAAPQAAAAATAPVVDDLDGLEIVHAPYLGSFYRAPKPGEAAYVEVGSIVAADSEICLVEVMKLFTAVRAGVAGRIARVLAADGAMVEAGQPLFAIEAMG